MRKQLAEMEAEAAKLKAMQEGGTPGEAGGASGAPANAAAAASDAAAKEEIDARSIFVGNVDYECTPEELQQHFNSCGTVNRVTILTDKFGNPKAFAYVEFLEVDAVGNAILLDNTELHGRSIRVSSKRTNVPGMKVRGRGGHGGRGRGYGGPPPWAGGGRGRGGYYAPRGGGYGGYAPRGGAGRGRGRGRFYSPY